MRRLIVFLGPPGAGKGTQGRRWAAEQGWQYVATGDLLRDAIQRGTPLGQQARDYVTKGELIPDEVMAQIIEELLATTDKDVVLDGYPRTLAQAHTLEALTDRWGWRLHAVVYLEVPEGELVDRLSARRVCPTCQAVYNLRSAPPRQDERCDHCGTALVQRDDDRPEVVANRLAVYQRQTHPVVEHYARRGVLRRLNASGTPDEVYRRVRQVIGE